MKSPQNLRRVRAPLLFGGVVVAAFALCGSSHAGDANCDDDTAAPSNAPVLDRRTCYNIFHPKPKDQLRDFSSSRPDQTTGPRSVDAGHFYLETGKHAPLPLSRLPSPTMTALLISCRRTPFLRHRCAGARGVVSKTVRPGGARRLGARAAG